MSNPAKRGTNDKRPIADGIPAKSPDGAPILADGYPLHPPPLVIGNWSFVICYEGFTGSFVNDVG